MDRQIEATQVTNTLAYLRLLAKDEQLNELNTILAYIKKNRSKYNKTFEYNAKYIKSLKRAMYLAVKNLQ